MEYEEDVVDVLVVRPGTVVTNVLVMVKVKVAERVEVVVRPASAAASAAFGRGADSTAESSVPVRSRN